MKTNKSILFAIMVALFGANVQTADAISKTVKVAVPGVISAAAGITSGVLFYKLNKINQELEEGNKSQEEIEELTNTRSNIIKALAASGIVTVVSGTTAVVFSRSGRKVEINAEDREVLRELKKAKKELKYAEKRLGDDEYGFWANVIMPFGYGAKAADKVLAKAKKDAIAKNKAAKKEKKNKKNKKN